MYGRIYKCARSIEKKIVWHDPVSQLSYQQVEQLIFPHLHVNGKRDSKKAQRAGLLDVCVGLAEGKHKCFSTKIKR